MTSTTWTRFTDNAVLGLLIQRLGGRVVIRAEDMAALNPGTMIMRTEDNPREIVYTLEPGPAVDFFPVSINRAGRELTMEQVQAFGLALTVRDEIGIDKAKEIVNSTGYPTVLPALDDPEALKAITYLCVQALGAKP